ncbi:MAG: 30S ribosomal protein S12 methylthiotransferase RimO [Candidatus Omnitrophica bacterium]|nr:30S ribosomal protein S12 methylthiotransferase RimO [Candidatus Omnitrophota bacterium]
MEKVSIISLGCPKNTVDSEKIIGVLADSGYMISTIPEESDFVIINTCAFIQPAVIESKNVISQFIRIKKRNKFKLIVTGCMPSRYYTYLCEEREIDGIIGLYHITQFPEILSLIASGKRICINSCGHIKGYSLLPRVISTMPYAYLKITEGCNNCCSYCTIPQIRGHLVSFPEKEILKEAENLFLSGVKELIIVGHDITAFGKDSGKKSLTRLVREIVGIGFPWIRLMYLHPSGITNELLELIGSYKQICKYLDIPLQHVNPVILKRMNRPVFDYGKLINRIRKFVPGITLRTTFIVGFPGETDQIFDELIEFVKSIKFERLGAFIYYPEEGTRSFLMDNSVPIYIKKRRYLRLINIQKKISKELALSFKNKILEIIIDKEKNGRFYGRTQMDAPDIDWIVTVHGKVRFGDMVNVRITKSSFYSLSGFVCSDMTKPQS